MPSKSFIVLVTLLLMGGGAAAFVGLRLDNARLRRQATDLRRKSAEIGRLREENDRTRTIMAQFRDGQEGAAVSIRNDIASLRGEVAALEQRAREGRSRHLAQTASDTDANATNRDPRKGYVRVENFSNVGRTTPGAAFQTLLWATMKGDDEVLAGSIALSEAARDKATALITGLPESTRAKYPTPEKLAALFFASVILQEFHALQISGESASDPTHTTLNVRVSGGIQNGKVPMVLGAGGWQLIVSDRMVDGIAKQLGGSGER